MLSNYYSLIIKPQKSRVWYWGKNKQINGIKEPRNRHWRKDSVQTTLELDVHMGKSG